MAVPTAIKLLLRNATWTNHSEGHHTALIIIMAISEINGYDLFK